MNISFASLSHVLPRLFFVAGFLLFFVLSANAEDDKKKSFDVPDLKEGKIELDEKGRYRLFVQNVAVQNLSDAQFAVMRQYDEALQKKRDAKSKQKSRALVVAIARSGSAKSLLYLHEQFETYSERRNNIAEGLSYYAREKKLRDSDWRLLVRSLNVVEEKQAEEVIDALLRFRRRANKAQWIRQLIIIGVSLEEKGASQAVKLVKHWMGRKTVKSTNSAKGDLKNWQKLFATRYPDEPSAAFPLDAKKSKWKYNRLHAILSKHEYDKINLEQGKKIFVKASCIKCHRLGEEGEKIGPNLTSISKKMQRKEILKAILFPSHFIPEEYPTTTLETKGGKVYTGMMGASGTETLLILGLDGKKIFIKKKDVENIRPNKTSAMPEKLLEELSQEEIIQLFGYIQSFSSQKTTGFHKQK